MLATPCLSVAVLVGSIAGCKGEPPHAGSEAAVQAAIQSCPPEVFLEELHASAFHFEHGPLGVARSHLEAARALKPKDVVSTKTLSQLSEISRRIDGDPNWAKSEVEHVRVAFRQWWCLTEVRHQRFHEKLPAIP